MKTALLGLSLSTVFLTLPGIGASGFHETARWNLGGDGGWDYLTFDDSSHRLFIARGNRVMVVDAETGKLSGEVPGLDGAHGVALVPGTTRGFATSGNSNKIISFDSSTLKNTGEIAAGTKPDAIAFDPATRRVFAFNGKSQNVTAVDAGDNHIAGTIALAGKPEFAVSDGIGLVFVNLEDKSQIQVLDTKELKAVKTFDLKPCEEPTGLSFNPKTRHLFVGCGNKMAAVVEADTGKILKTFPAGDHIDATAFDGEHDLDFVSAGEGRLTVLKDGPVPEKVEDIKTEKGARTLALDPVHNRVFLATARFKEKAKGDPKARPEAVSGSFFVQVLGK